MAHVDSTVVDPGALPERAAEASELRTELIAALNELGPEEHQAVALCVLGGLTQAAASEMTGTNLNTIKARVRRGLERLREKLKKRPDSIEAFMALPVLPYPSGSLEDAVLRWSETARGAEGATAISTATTSKAVLITCVMLLVVGTGLNVAYNLVDFGTSSPEVGPAPIASSDQPSDTLPAGDPGKARPLSPEGLAATEDGADTSFAIDPSATGIKPEGVESNTGPLVVMRATYPSGALENQGTALNTPNGLVMHGHFLAYYETGELKAEYTYVHGVREGAWTEFHLNGKVSYRGEYAAGKKHGFWTYYDEGGTTDTSGEYFHDKKVGTWTMFHPTGEHRRLDTYVDGVLSGVRKEFKPGGVLLQTTEYANNKKNGLQIEYDAATGNPVRESTFKDGEKTGKDRLFDPATGLEREQ